MNSLETKDSWLKILDGEDIDVTRPKKEMGEKYPSFNSVDAAIDCSVSINQPVRAWINDTYSRYAIECYPRR